MVSILLISDDDALMKKLQCVVGANVEMAQSLPVDADYQLCLWDISREDVFDFNVEDWSIVPPIRILIGNPSQIDYMLEYVNRVDDIWLKPLSPPLMQKRLQNLLLARDHRRSLSETLHQLKNPLAAIRGYSDVLLKMSGQTDKLPPLVESQHRFVAAIYNASGKMEVMMNSLRDRMKSSSD